jgi:orotate phosphoribosyltransferase
MSPSDVAVNLILRTENVITYAGKDPIEVKPGRHAPIHINFKKTLPFKNVRETLANLLIERIASDGATYVCGLESGGSYFASRCSDDLCVPLALFRKHEKQHAEQGQLAGSNPSAGSKVAIIDDTLVSGRTVEPVIRHMRRFTSDIRVYTLLSYGLDEHICERLRIARIASITQMSSLIEAGVACGAFSPELVVNIQAFIQNQSMEAKAN